MDRWMGAPRWCIEPLLLCSAFGCMGRGLAAEQAVAVPIYGSAAESDWHLASTDQSLAFLGCRAALCCAC